MLAQGSEFACGSWWLLAAVGKCCKDSGAKFRAGGTGPIRGLQRLVGFQSVLLSLNRQICEIYNDHNFRYVSDVVFDGHGEFLI